MSFNQFWIILRARYKLVLAALLITVLTVFAISLSLPKTYKATNTLVLNYKGTDPLTGQAPPAQVMDNYMATQVNIVESENAAMKVVAALKMDQQASEKQQFEAETGGKGDIRNWLAKRLLRGLDVTPVRDSSVLNIAYTSTDPVLAATVANAFAAQYQALVVQLTVAPLQQASGFFTQQLKTLQANLEAAQRKLSKYQQNKGIVSVDSRLDVETARLNDLSNQLVTAQGQAMEAGSRQRMAQGSSANESPDVAGNPLIQNLKINLGNAESKFSEISQRLDKNHPQYQAAKAEVDQLRAELNRQIRITSSSVGNNARILQQHEGEIRAALAAQKNKVLTLNRARDDMAVLNKEVENAQLAYQAAAQRYSQVQLQGQSTQSDVAVLNPATVPTSPAGPKILFYTMASVVLGAMLGLGLALLAEMLDRRVRSADDLIQLLHVPVLGEIGWGIAQHQRVGLLPTPFIHRLFSS
ncbi:tyrosine-protein kinase Wzc [Sulfuriferula multivorans]|uniref:Tyrosine-protein kinase Wzc n=1 Tax=Sulfuriferula multivorans TaxID=1559896 RepID=A0A401JGS4_9PROT|nr:chain length determinant protein EpsF [Sulfuriferula multivorans]GBL46841.1 tyrosine-protein kinase Wzc [Sulfuriferula multivorans]